MFILNTTESSVNSKNVPRVVQIYLANQDGSFRDFRYSFPVFFKYPLFRDLRLCYFVGIGVQE